MKFPVVGMQHRFPSAMVLSLIPPGTEFFLRREPENPHDPNAIQVWIEDLRTILSDDDMEQVDNACTEQDKNTPEWSEPFMLGYIKALSVNEDVVGAEVLAPRIDSLIESGAIDSAEEIPVVLVYGESGRPAVEIVEDEGEEVEAPVVEADDDDLDEENYGEDDEDDEEDEPLIAEDDDTAELEEQEGEDYTKQDRE